MWRMARESSLTGDEQPVLLLHPHWKTLIRPILIAVLVVAVALAAALDADGRLVISAPPDADLPVAAGDIVHLR